MPKCYMLQTGKIGTCLAEFVQTASEAAQQVSDHLLFADHTIMLCDLIGNPSLHNIYFIRDMLDFADANICKHVMIGGMIVVQSCSQPLQQTQASSSIMSNSGVHHKPLELKCMCAGCEDSHVVCECP